MGYSVNLSETPSEYHQKNGAKMGRYGPHDSRRRECRLYRTIGAGMRRYGARYRIG